MRGDGGYYCRISPSFLRLIQRLSCYRFFEIEAVTVLTMFISRYKIEVKYESRFSGETFDERKERILRAVPDIVLAYVSNCSTIMRYLLALIATVSVAPHEFHWCSRDAVSEGPP